MNGAIFKQSNLKMKSEGEQNNKIKKLTFCNLGQVSELYLCMISADSQWQSLMEKARLRLEDTGFDTEMTLETSLSNSIFARAVGSKSKRRLFSPLYEEIANLLILTNFLKKIWGVFYYFNRRIRENQEGSSIQFRVKSVEFIWN
jgi:uncharacterized protein YjbI with pentapeptide repeats